MKTRGETQEQEACDDESSPESEHAQLAVAPGKARRVLLQAPFYRIIGSTNNEMSI